MPGRINRKHPPTVHPHVCGEHSAWQACAAGLGGSSPRVWGAYFVRVESICPCRFIPTCVGSMVIRCAYTSHATVHPHVCGEHTGMGWIIENQIGSSPRVWGASCESGNGSTIPRFIPTCVGSITGERRLLFAGRFIPTCVGSMITCPHKQGDLTVHPHVCGEHAIFRSVGDPCGGSSPRVWGAFISTKLF